MYKRAEYQVITDRMKEPRKFIQVVMGARQIGKSTVVKQVLQDLDMPYQFFSADNVPATNSAWISDCWVCLTSSFLPTMFPPQIVLGFPIAGQLCAA